MPSTYTVNLGIEQPATGEQSGTWGDTINDNSTILDEAINGVVTITLAAAGSFGSPNQIAITNGASSAGRNKWIEFADDGDLGAAAYVELIPNDAEKICFIRNSLAGSRSVFIFQGTYDAARDLEIAAGTDVLVKFSGGGSTATVINVYANLKVDGIVATTADINGGTMDSTTIGGSTAAAVTGTTIVANTSLNIAADGATVTGIKDEDNMASNSATKLATQQSIKAYVDAQVATVDTLSKVLAIGNTSGSTDIDMDNAQKVQFRDAAIYINSSVDGQLDIVADTEIQIAATTIDINGAVALNSALTTTSTIDGRDVAADGVTADAALPKSGGTMTGAITTAGISSVTAGTGNFVAGAGAGDSIVAGGNNNTLIGNGAGTAITTGYSNTASGQGALYSNTTGANNTASGFRALYTNTTGSTNTASGLQALYSNTTGSGNTASGKSALYSNTTGANNTASGQSALQTNTTGTSNTASGVNALYNNTTGANNTASGQSALYSNTTGYNNTASGHTSLYNNTTGHSNTASGQGALYSNTTGHSNTASGLNALYSNTTGHSNTASGKSSLYNNTTGSGNTASGLNALTSNTTGSGNTAINPLNSAGSNAPVFNPTTENNRFCMGSTGVTNAYIQVAWTVVSDARDKINFAPVPHGLEFVKALQPTAYQFRTARNSEETNGGVRYGFKAQDVLALEGDSPVIVDNEDEDKLRMVDTALIPVLVKALQELSTKNDALEARLTALEGK